ncbi:MAG: MBL fold metallo-hydrolase [Clostridium sp.]|jgi:glyoxylase-like metal-dependent hydrolase (beta-lactamase superfamily II)|uniref:MBL fold metallo-hydrolase n=1 Tax=Clostridium sp. TaxID=1506 RepID=UPI0025BCF196|nr:MBL fold metallo-hydrolase [Clostridium sp.]MCH3964645.1 MBL fold metallo-hydrolase [Clostridium sp.]MCI1715116.1 MBL fold metallo-hydrolase [Clostridium sp.]MCI1799378.1 MBL fold metallo-hydrolase [Clostridium sp.]MCI1813299.1 MBL fold metallo-hydrolase [Clostridium sp.]MCI1870190.1 MBL fold metallo-hydrolase [Clostridium sp.]
MNLNKINGNTYYVDAATNSGIFKFKNRNCLIVDTGLSNSAAKKLDLILVENKLHPKYIINTHSHLDHCGGNTYFRQNYPGITVYASKNEKLFMENEYLHPSILSSAYPLKMLNKSNKPIDVDFVLDYGVNKIGDDKFNIIPLPGHSVEHIGIITPDRVCFLGDSIFSSEILDKYSFPYLYNISDSLDSLGSINEIDADYFLISHSERLIIKEDMPSLIDKNVKNIENYRDEILELLEQPLTREEILENITILSSLKLDFNEYYLNFAGVSAFISYLYNSRLIDCTIEDGKLYYFKSKNS